MNSTFYGQPRAHVSKSWAHRTPPGFEFAIKLYQKFTHPRMYRDRIERSLPAGSADDDAVSALIAPADSDFDEFRTGIAPLAESGKLGVLLAQFPPSFKDTAASRDYLAGLLRRFSEHRVAVELRHRSWSDAIGETLGLLNSFGAAWVQIDEPKFQFSIRQNYLPNITGFYYMRLHGRNAAQWWKHEKSEDRYNYLYSRQELQPFVETARAARELVKKAYLYTNNHYSAKSVANAAMIKQQLGEPLDGDYPPEFVERYPDLKDAVKIGTDLFTVIPNRRTT